MSFVHNKPKQTAENTIRVTKRYERIFSHAVALQQSGRLRSLIFCQRTCIYILNQDHTILIRFPLQGGETSRFKHPVSFKANDYDSNEFTERDGQIIFKQKHGEYYRDKACRVPNLTGKEVSKMYKKLSQQGTKKNRVPINSDFLKCMNSHLTHLEFQGRKGKLICRQRDIYSGSMITITKNLVKKTALFASTVQNFSTIGLRTTDFEALFSFTKTIYFYFAGKDVVLFESKNAQMPFTGIISRCVYDELGVDNGR